MGKEMLLMVGMSFIGFGLVGLLAACQSRKGYASSTCLIIAGVGACLL